MRGVGGELTYWANSEDGFHIHRVRTAYENETSGRSNSDHVGFQASLV